MSEKQSQFRWLIRELLDDYQRGGDFALIHQFLDDFRGMDREVLLQSILAHAFQTNDWNLAEKCVEEGYQLRPLDASDAGPVHAAMANLGDCGEAVDWLLRRGAEVSRRNSGNATPLMVASRRGFLDTVRALLAAGADPDARSGIDDNWTALMAAAAGGYKPIVELLIAHGADPKLTDGHGDRAARLAEKRGHNDVAQILNQAEKKTGQVGQAKKRGHSTF